MDSEGQYVESALDVVSIGIDIADICSNPYNILAWGALGADAICLLLPGATGGGGIVRVISSYDKLDDVLKYADEILGAGKNIVSSLKDGKAMHKLYNPVIESTDSFLDSSLRKVFEGRIDSLLRPDGINKVSQVIYELKPCNYTSLKKAIKQVQNYLDKIDDAEDWITVFDLYF